MAYSVQLLKPALDFIQNLPVKMRAKVYRTIGLLELFGNNLPKPHSKALKDCDGLKELRVKFSSDICRLFYFHFKNKIYIITSGYKKKDRKTDKKEIKKAITLMSKILKG